MRLWANPSAGGFDQLEIGGEVGEAEGRQTALGLAEEFARAPELEVGLGDAETVTGFGEDREALAGFGAAEIGDEHTIGLMGAPADSATELMELGETETFGVFDDHEGGVGDVEADFDDRAGDQPREVAATERGHDPVAFGRGQLTVEHADGVGCQFAGDTAVFGDDGFDGVAVVFLDPGIDEERLAAFVEFLADESPDLREAFDTAQVGFDLATAGWQGIDDGGVQVAVKGETERARDGGGGHDQEVGVMAFAKQLFALGNAEFVLFVDDDEAETIDGKARLDQRMSADDEPGCGRVEWNGGG